jgi:hypothetical protein
MGHCCWGGPLPYGARPGRVQTIPRPPPPELKHLISHRMDRGGLGRAALLKVDASLAHGSFPADLRDLVTASM